MVFDSLELEIYLGFIACIFGFKLIYIDACFSILYTTRWYEFKTQHGQFDFAESALQRLDSVSERRLFLWRRSGRQLPGSCRLFNLCPTTPSSSAGDADDNGKAGLPTSRTKQNLRFRIRSGCRENLRHCFVCQVVRPGPFGHFCQRN